jgi:hypothetical protein
VERMIKAGVFFVRGRGTKEPEAVIMHAYLLAMAMRWFKLLYGLRSQHELLPYLKLKQDYGRTEFDDTRCGDDPEDT